MTTIDPANVPTAVLRRPLVEIYDDISETVRGQMRQLYSALTTQYPPKPIDRIATKGFQSIFLMADPVSDRIASAYWPGLALLMTPLVFFDTERLLNPTMSVPALWVTRERMDAKRLRHLEFPAFIPPLRCAKC